MTSNSTNSSRTFRFLAVLSFFSTAFMAQGQDQPSTEQASEGAVKAPLSNNSVMTTPLRRPLPSPWSATYLNYMNGPTFAKADGSSINHLLSAKYRFENGWSASGTLAFDTNFGHQDKATLAAADPYFTLAAPSFYKSGNTEVFFQVYYALPLSQDSRAADIAGTLTPRVYWTTRSGLLEVSNILIPRIPIRMRSLEEQKVFSLGNYFIASYALSKRVKADMGFYPEWTFRKGIGSSFNQLASYPGFTYEIDKRTTLSIYTEIHLLRPQASTTSLGGILNIVLL